jgi:kanamycin kinase
MFPKSINKYIKNLNYTIDTIGRSEDEVYNFEDKYILKVSVDKNRLLREKERIDFLNFNNIPGSKTICYVEENQKYYYLRTCINGESLISRRFINNPDLLVDVLVKVIKVLRELDSIKCPFNSTDNIGNDFVHGDLCLPNIFVNKDNEFIGFIDLDNSGIGDKWYDYSWLLWSLEYNLKSNKYNNILLNKLKLKFNKEKYDMYIPKDYCKHK